MHGQPHIKWHQLAYLYSAIKMIHGPINTRFMKVYLNKIKALSRHTASQSHHNQHDISQQLHTVPRVTRGIAVEREAHLPVTSRFIEKSHVKSKSRTSRPTVLTFSASCAADPHSTLCQGRTNFIRRRPKSVGNQYGTCCWSPPALCPINYALLPRSTTNHTGRSWE